jgi:hypothetical protein
MGSDDPGFLEWISAVKFLNPDLIAVDAGGYVKSLFDKQYAPSAAVAALKSVPQAKKVGVLVLGAYAPLVLDQMIEKFEGNNFRFFLHLDSKQNLEAYTGKMKNTSALCVVEPRVKVYWGAISMVEAEIVLAKAALADPSISSMILISDDSAPLAAPSVIYQALLDQPDRITTTPNGRPRHWYDEFFYTDSDFAALRGVDMGLKHFLPSDFANISRLEKLRARGKKKIDILYFGRQWWSLSRASLQTVLQFVDQDEHFMESFRFSLFPDETFFPTAYRLCFPAAPASEIPTFADYGKPVHPWQYSSADEILAVKTGPEHLFIRKIKPGCEGVIAALAETWILPADAQIS